MVVGKLIDSIDKSLVLELYGLGETPKPQHLGTYNLDDEVSRASLLENYGETPVKSKDLYKAYVYVYIDTASPS